MTSQPTTIEISRILREVEEDLDQVTRWRLHEEWHASVTRCYCRAEALIELLEVEHCGATGGFGVFRGRTQQGSKYAIGLRGRLEWLRMVYGGEGKGKRKKKGK